MKKQLMAGMMAASMALSLAACGGSAASSAASAADSTSGAASTSTAASTSSDEQVTLRFAWWGGDERANATMEVINKFMEENPNIKIEAEYGSSDGYHDKLATQLASGTAADIVQIDPETMPSFVSTGDYFLDYKDYDFDLSNFDPNYIGLRVNGNYGKWQGWGQKDVCRRPERTPLAERRSGRAFFTPPRSFRRNKPDAAQRYRAQSGRSAPAAFLQFGWYHGAVYRQPRPFWDGAVFCFLRPPAPSAIIINLTCKRQGQSRRENLCNGPV